MSQQPFQEPLKEPFDAPAVARKLLRDCRQGALATLMADASGPYSSLVAVADCPDGAPLLLSRLAVHTRNILADPRVSLMLDERRADDPLQGTRIMVNGRAQRVDDTTLRSRYLVVHPSAEQFVDFPDFAFYRIEPAGLHLVAGFGRIADLAPAQFLT